MENFGTLTHIDGYVKAVMTRDTEASALAVWQMLSEESERVKWLAPGTIDLFEGGRAALNFVDSYVLVNSEVSACDAPHLLEFSWSGGDEPKRPVRFEISATKTGSRIRLSVSIPETEVVARSCAGWEAHLTMLEAALAEVPIKFPLDRFNECRQHFERELTTILMSEVEVLRL